ncbi:MAG TPA: hypothetical protein P5137_14830, partial [Candidatus Brocadiia bacterium]|nr:hypothetical protein [Candidatus Brocadiia bacterium]
MTPHAYLPPAVVAAWSNLTEPAKDAAVILATYMNVDATAGAFAKVGTMAERARKTMRAFQYGLSELRRLGLVESIRPKGPHELWRHRWKSPEVTPGDMSPRFTPN